MRHFITTLIIAILSATTVSAKQIMTMLNGEEIEVVIVTLGSKQISYKKASNPSGPTYTVDKNKVFYITYDDGKKEIITDLQTTAPTMANGTAGTISGAQTSMGKAIGDIPEKKYFDKISLYPRAYVGYHATASGYKDSYDIDWGGLAWSADLNILFPLGNTNAWSAGIGFSGLGGEMTQLYTTNSGKDKHKDKMGNFTTTYLTLPIGYWHKSCDWFMLGFTNRFEFLISQKMEGKKIEDAFNGFRDNLLIDGVFTLGQLDLGLQLGFNLTSAMKGEDLDWSPTISFGATVGYRF